METNISEITDQTPTVTTMHTWETPKGEQSYTLSHTTPQCPNIATGKVVGMETGLPGWPCAECISTGAGHPTSRIPGPNVDADFGSGVGAGHSVAEMATEKQVNYILFLQSERECSRPRLSRQEATELSKSAAKKAIDQLLAEPMMAPAAKPVAPVRPNKYAGSCATCHGHVAEGAGSLANEDGRWVVRHLPGACPEAAPKVDAYVPVRGDVHVVDGKYYRVSVGQNSGQPYVNEWTGSSWEFAKGAVAKLSANTVATAEQAAEFGHAFSRCVFCSLPLDLDRSIEVGYGQKCAAHRGLPW